MSIVRAATVAWLITAVYSFYQYTLRSAPTGIGIVLTLLFRETRPAARLPAETALGYTS